VHLELMRDEDKSAWVGATTSRGGEVKLSQLSAKQRTEFIHSDSVEWGTIVQTGAVKICSAERSRWARQVHGDRIMSSRMVRRYKPQEGTFADPIAKSRWCVRGFEDPDMGQMRVYSPTPQNTSMHACCSVVLDADHDMAIADAKNAFCQSLKLERPNGPLFVEPCEGIDIGDGLLIEIVAPVYGLGWMMLY
jgi:hypothetical protein